MKLLKGILIYPIRFYQKYVSPFNPPRCRFRPSCSQYGIEAVEEYGPILGALKTAYRLLRCNPLNKGGYDPVKKIYRIGVVGDTHASKFEEIDKEILKILRKMDRIIHIGDYTSQDVLDGFKKIKKGKFKGVYGNTDTSEVRAQLPRKDVLEIAGKRIGIIHPAVGGPPEGLEELVKLEFESEDIDTIVYGHTHDSDIKEINNILLFNPGQGYRLSFMQASIGILTVDNEIKGEIIKF